METNLRRSNLWGKRGWNFYTRCKSGWMGDNPSSATMHRRMVEMNGSISGQDGMDQEQKGRDCFQS